MEDALSLRDALDAAILYRVIRTPDGVAFQVGTSGDDLFDIEEVVSMARVSLERGDEVGIDDRPIAK